MDVNTLSVLPHRRTELLTSQENQLLGAISAVKSSNQAAADSLPPLHTLMAGLDAVQGAQELEYFGRASQPAFVVDVNSEQQELAQYAQGAFQVELTM
ncbi:MAG: hypothetical protein ILA30_00685 [Selenomonas sp.]|mgnify:CR=1 FL=1|nr:hypothetical protein [Selenomonas sp.]